MYNCFTALSSAEVPYERFVCLGGRAGSDGKRVRAAVSLSPQAYGQEAFTVKAVRKRPLRRREVSQPSLTINLRDNVTVF